MTGVANKFCNLHNDTFKILFFIEEKVEEILLKRDLDQGAWELFANIFEIESSAKRIQSESKFARDELEAKLEDEKKKLVNTLSLQEEAKKQHNAALDNLRLEMRAKYDRIRHLEGKVTEKELQVGNLQVNVVIIDTQVK